MSRPAPATNPASIRIVDPELPQSRVHLGGRELPGRARYADRPPRSRVTFAPIACIAAQRAGGSAPVEKLPERARALRKRRQHRVAVRDAFVARHPQTAVDVSRRTDPLADRVRGSLRVNRRSSAVPAEVSAVFMLTRRPYLTPYLTLMATMVSSSNRSLRRLKRRHRRQHSVSDLPRAALAVLVQHRLQPLVAKHVPFGDSPRPQFRR